MIRFEIGKRVSVWCCWVGAITQQIDTYKMKSLVRREVKIDHSSSSTSISF